MIRQHRKLTEHRAWWTVDEFAELTRRTAAAVRAEISRGTLPAIRIGRRWFIDPGYFERRFEAAAREVDEEVKK